MLWIIYFGWIYYQSRILGCRIISVTNEGHNGLENSERYSHLDGSAKIFDSNNMVIRRKEAEGDWCSEVLV